RPVTTATSTRCCSSWSRRAGAHATPASTAASSACSAVTQRPARCERERERGRDPAVPRGVRRARGRPPGGAGVARGGRGPREGAGTEARAGFLLESVEHAERWGRFSFIGRDPLLTMVVRGRSVAFDRPPPPGVPTDQGALVALEALLAAYRAPRLADLPPFH